MRCPHHHIPFIARQIIDAVGDGFASRILWKVRLKNLQRGAPPRASGIFESADEFFFLRIYDNNRQFCFCELAAEACNVTKLAIALGVLTRTQPFAIATEGNPFEL